MGARTHVFGRSPHPNRSTRVGIGVGLLAFGVLAAGCSDAPSGPSGPHDELSERRTTAHGVYFHAPGDTVYAEAQETYYLWLFDRMDVEPTAPLVFLKYRSRAHMERLTGESVNGWAERDTRRFHTIWPFDNHESVHALASAEWKAAAPALLSEGFAVAHQVAPHAGIMEPVWSGTPIDTIAARALRNGTMPPVGKLLESPDFRRYDEALSYPIAGSFVRSVLRRHGYDALEAFFGNSDFEDSGSELRASFRGAFGEEIEDAWEVWLDSLR